MFIVDGDVTMDEAGTVHLSLPLGPFDSREEAVGYMESMGPLFGEWSVVPLWAP